MIIIGVCGLVLLLFIGLLLIDESEEREGLKLVEIGEKLLKVAEKKSCEGCKHLDFYNDGSPFCAKGIDHACISSGFSMKDEGERTT